jgi:poly(3-hydroxybutyrate) depolymerase
MLYDIYEMNHAAVAPWRALADASRLFWKSPVNPLSTTYIGRSMAASLELFERVTRRYGKPAFNITDIEVGNRVVPVTEIEVLKKPFGRLLRFAKDKGAGDPGRKLLIVAPLSGHYATLLRGTVKAMLPHFDVHITDWTDARDINVMQGNFDLEDYIDYVIEMLRLMGPGASVMAVCQPSVPVLAAVSLMSAAADPCMPTSMILMGGPIDTRRNPTAVNRLAVKRGAAWFRKNVIVKVPWPNAGFGRHVYPGFLQLSGFMTMNLDRHLDAHGELFWHLVRGDGDSAAKHRGFYDEFLSVMDLTAEFYLQTVERVFVEHALPRGTFTHRGTPVTPAAITKTALMTVEGERDDISGVGQTAAAHDLCTRIPEARKQHYLQLGVGHYGVFNGGRFRKETAPKIVSFIKANA